MRDYYLLIDGEQVGPYTGEQLREMLGEGGITTESLAWHDGLTDWVQVGTLVGPPVAPHPMAPKPQVRQVISAAPSFTENSRKSDEVVQTNVRQGALQIVGSDLHILAVAHPARRPRYWIKRRIS